LQVYSSSLQHACASKCSHSEWQKHFWFGIYLIFHLLNELLTAIRSIADEVYVFQQDSALARRAHQTVELLRREKSKFIAPHGH